MKHDSQDLQDLQGSIDQMDEILMKALSSTETPCDELNQKTKAMMKECIHMKRKPRASLRLIVAVAAVLTVTSATAYGLLRYFTPQEVASTMDYPALAEAFDGEDSIIMKETVSSDGYDITLLGTVFGENLTGFSEDVDTQKTYAVVAIEKQNGKMVDTSSDAYGEEDFFISPLVKGQKPWRMNIFTMGGSSVTQVVDGILYRLIECDSVEMFATEGVYIGVSSNNGVFCNNESFSYDESTGVISGNPDATGVSVVFDLPIDPAKADPDKVKAFLEGQELQTKVDDTASDDADVLADEGGERDVIFLENE